MSDDLREDEREEIARRVLRVRERIAAALERAGRSGERVTIVGVTKTFGPDKVDALISAGVSDIGENRVQEFLAKAPLVSRPCRWHLVGTLQRNKARKVLGKIHMLHSLDSLKLAETLNRLGEEMGIVTRVLVEVNTSGEPTKRGFRPEEVVDTVGRVVEMPFLRVEGLMTIGPLTDDTTRVREAFRTLYRQRERVRSELRLPLPELSMGMSDDFEVAVEEGSTMVRLGRVLLGERESG